MSTKELAFAASTIWVVLAAILVLFMQAGFAFLEAGLTRMKNVGHIAAKNVLILGVVSIVYYLVGFGIAFGDDQCVLAVVSRIADVEAALREAGCQSWKTLTHDDGVPDGWVLLRDVVPTLPVLSTPTADILNTLRPAADFEIAFEGGIRLDYSNWLEGNPPTIRLYGHATNMGMPLIDAKSALFEECAGGKRLTAPGWDTVGEHQVWCSGITRSYSVVTRTADPDFWRAYAFSAFDSGRSTREIVICGPLVREVASAALDQNVPSRLCAAPASNPVILGENPGEILFLPKWNAATNSQRLGSPPFEAVWAVPSLPLLCDKGTHRIKFIGDRNAAPSLVRQFRNARERNALIGRWCVHVMDLGRKGVPVESDDPDIIERWRRCRTQARDVWRSRR